MRNKKEEAPDKNQPSNKTWGFIKKHGFTVVIASFVVLMLVSPNAKSWVLRQLMYTGIFNASIDKEVVQSSEPSNIDFSFEDEQGQIKNTADLRGKVVFINFWASWCPPCRAEFPSIEKLYSTFKNNPDIVFLMMDMEDDFSAGKKFIEKGQFSFPIYKAQSRLSDQLYSGTLPTTVVLDKSGNIRLHHKGLANYGSDKFINQIKSLLAKTNDNN